MNRLVFHFYVHLSLPAAIGRQTKPLFSSVLNSKDSRCTENKYNLNKTLLTRLPKRTLSEQQT